MEPNQNQPVQPVGQEGEKRSLGPIIGIIVVIIILILGAFYFWGGKLSNGTSSDEVSTSSDEVSAIEGELNAAGDLEIDLSGLDTVE
jgi:uncharacterized membrane protein